MLDNTLIAYCLAEDARARLPAIVYLDRFYLSFTRGPAELPDSSAVQAFLPDYDERLIGIEGRERGQVLLVAEIRILRAAQR